jgi:hypothetical protein
MYRRTKKVFRATIIEGFGGLCFLLIVAVTLPRLHDSQGQASNLPGPTQAGEFTPDTMENPQFLRTARTLLHEWFGTVESHSGIESHSAADLAISKAEANRSAVTMQPSRMQFAPQRDESDHAVIKAYAVQPLPAGQIQVQPIPSHWQ